MNSINSLNIDIVTIIFSYLIGTNNSSLISLCRISKHIYWCTKNICSKSFRRYCILNNIFYSFEEVYDIIDEKLIRQFAENDFVVSPDLFPNDALMYDYIYHVVRTRNSGLFNVVLNNETMRACFLENGKLFFDIFYSTNINEERRKIRNMMRVINNRILELSKTNNESDNSEETIEDIDAFIFDNIDKIVVHMVNNDCIFALKDFINAIVGKTHIGDIKIHQLIIDTDDEEEEEEEDSSDSEDDTSLVIRMRKILNIFERKDFEFLIDSGLIPISCCNKLLTDALSYNDHHYTHILLKRLSTSEKAYNFPNLLHSNYITEIAEIAQCILENNKRGAEVIRTAFKRSIIEDEYAVARFLIDILEKNNLSLISDSTTINPSITIESFKLFVDKERQATSNYLLFTKIFNHLVITEKNREYISAIFIQCLENAITCNKIETIEYMLNISNKGKISGDCSTNSANGNESIICKKKIIINYVKRKHKEIVKMALLSSNVNVFKLFVKGNYNKSIIMKMLLILCASNSNISHKYVEEKFNYLMRWFRLFAGFTNNGYGRIANKRKKQMKKLLHSAYMRNRSFIEKILDCVKTNNFSIEDRLFIFNEVKSLFKRISFGGSTSLSHIRVGHEYFPDIFVARFPDYISIITCNKYSFDLDTALNNITPENFIKSINKLYAIIDSLYTKFTHESDEKYVSVNNMLIKFLEHAKNNYLSKDDFCNKFFVTNFRFLPIIGSNNMFNYVINEVNTESEPYSSLIDINWLFKNLCQNSMCNRAKAIFDKIKPSKFDEDLFSSCIPINTPYSFRMLFNHELIELLLDDKFSPQDSAQLIINTLYSYSSTRFSKYIINMIPKMKCKIKISEKNVYMNEENYKLLELLHEKDLLDFSRYTYEQLPTITNPRLICFFINNAQLSTAIIKSLIMNACKRNDAALVNYLIEIIGRNGKSNIINAFYEIKSSLPMKIKECEIIEREANTNDDSQDDMNNSDIYIENEDVYYTYKIVYAYVGNRWFH